MILHVTLWLQMCCTRAAPPRECPGVLWPHSFINSCTCTGFVWYLLRKVTPSSHSISVILTCTSYVLLLIHTCTLGSIEYTYGACWEAFLTRKFLPKSIVQNYSNHFLHHLKSESLVIKCNSCPVLVWALH